MLLGGMGPVNNPGHQRRQALRRLVRALRGTGVPRDRHHHPRPGAASHAAPVPLPTSVTNDDRPARLLVARGALDRGRARSCARPLAPSPRRLQPDEETPHHRRGAGRLRRRGLARARSAAHSLYGAARRPRDHRARAAVRPAPRRQRHGARRAATTSTASPIMRAQDNYVVQWGDADGKKPIGDGAAHARGGVRAAAARAHASRSSPTRTPTPRRSVSSTASPWRRIRPRGRAWLVHCYGMVGAGRDNDVDSGGGTELYVVIGQAPRHLDRNVTLLGRVVQGMELLAVMPRGSGALGLLRAPRAARADPLGAGGERCAGGAAHASSRCCAPTRRPFSPTSRRVATVSRSGSRCRPGASTCATFRSRCGCARGRAPVAAPSVVRRAARAGPRRRPQTASALLARVLRPSAGAARAWRCATARAASGAAPAAAAESGGSSARTMARSFGGSAWNCCQRLRSAWRCSGGKARQWVKRSRAWSRCSGDIAEPALAAARERLLTLRRQRVPLAAEASTAAAAAAGDRLDQLDAAPAAAAAGAAGGASPARSSGAAATRAAPRRQQRASRCYSLFFDSRRRSRAAAVQAARRRLDGGAAARRLPGGGRAAFACER